MFRSGATTVVLAVLLGGATPSAAAPALTWGACQDPYLVEAGAQCAVLQVPLDHAKPRGAQIPIALSRIKATATGADRLGPLLSNPGGPGAPGLDGSADLAALLSPEVAGRYDLIGFDPRGVGRSGPDLSCDPGYHRRPALDYVPSDPGRARGLSNARTTNSPPRKRPNLVASALQRPLRSLLSAEIGCGRAAPSSGAGAQRRTLAPGATRRGGRHRTSGATRQAPRGGAGAVEKREGTAPGQPTTPTPPPGNQPLTSTSARCPQFSVMCPAGPR